MNYKKNVYDCKLTEFGKCSKPLIELFFLRQSMLTGFDASLIILKKVCVTSMEAT